MAKIQTEVIRHDKWGRCIVLNNGSIELIASLDFGPRILHVSSAGGKNLFFEDPDRNYESFGEQFVEAGWDAWKLYGGHRLWTSPEALPRTYYPDHDPVEWEPSGDNGIVLRPQPERWTQVAKEIEIRLEHSAPHAAVIHRVANRGAWPVTFAPWALSVMSGGGRAVVPLTGTDNGLLPNRRFIHWPYNRLNDPRVKFTESEMIVDQGEGPTPYKVGTDNEAGWAAYSNHGDTFIKRYKPVRGGTYPDFGVSFEMYTNTMILELETLGELREVAPGETSVHEEQWQVIQGLDLKRGDPAGAVEMLKPHVK